VYETHFASEWIITCLESENVDIDYLNDSEPEKEAFIMPPNIDMLPEIEKLEAVLC